MLVCTGDFTTFGEGLGSFLDWLENLPYRHRILVCGNHEAEIQLPDCGHVLTVLEQRILVIEGVTFAGVGAFDRWYTGASPAFLEACAQSGVDVLLSHVPPSGFLSGERFGSEVLRAEVERLKPRCHLFGHVHEQFGMVASRGTLFVNGALSGDPDSPLRTPRVLEI